MGNKADIISSRIEGWGVGRGFWVLVWEHWLVVVVWIVCFSKLSEEMCGVWGANERIWKACSVYETDEKRGINYVTGHVEAERIVPYIHTWRTAELAGWLARPISQWIFSGWELNFV